MKTTGNRTDERIETMLGGARGRDWPGPDHSDRVDSFLKEQAMGTQSKAGLGRVTIALIAAGVLGGGAVAAAVTHQVMSRRATIITDDGTEYNVELTDTPEGAAGSWTMEDGTVYGINMVEDGQSKNVTVDIDSPKGGTSTVILDNGVAPTVTTAPGQKAQIRVQEIPEGAAGVFTDEDGNTFEVDQDAVDSWVQDDDSDD